MGKSFENAASGGSALTIEPIKVSRAHEECYGGKMTPELTHDEVPFGGPIDVYKDIDIARLKEFPDDVFAVLVNGKGYALDLDKQPLHARLRKDLFELMRRLHPGERYSTLSAVSD